MADTQRFTKGTFIRSYAIDSIVSQFLNMPGPKKQIVALGAGFDTRYFNIKVRWIVAMHFTRSQYCQGRDPQSRWKRTLRKSLQILWSGFLRDYNEESNDDKATQGVVLVDGKGRSNKDWTRRYGPTGRRLLSRGRWFEKLAGHC